MKGVLNGIVSRKKDDGKVSTMLYLSGVTFGAYDITADICLGFKTVEVYYAGEVNAKPGDTLQIDYEPGFQGRAQVADISVLKRKEEK